VSHSHAHATDTSREQKEHEGTPGKAGANFDRQKNTLPPRTTLQTPRHGRDPQGTLILRPQRRGRLVGTPAGQEAVAILKSGKPVMLVTPASTPTAADPGERSGPQCGK